MLPVMIVYVKSFDESTCMFSLIKDDELLRNITKPGIKSRDDVRKN